MRVLLVILAYWCWLNVPKALAQSSDQHYQTALNLANNGQDREALTAFNACLKINPYHLGALMGRGVVYFRLQDFSKAEQDLTASIKLDPKNAAGFYNLGLVLAETGRYQEAISAYTAAIALDPDQDKFFYSRAIAHYAQKQVSAARQDYLQARKLNPKNAAAAINLGVLEQTNGNLTSAKRCYTEALALQPQSFTARYNRGLLLLEAKQYPEAVEDLQVAHHQRPKDPEVAEAFAIALQKAGQHHQACTLAKQTNLDQSKFCP